jgi:hypothetical protein
MKYHLKKKNQTMKKPLYDKITLHGEEPHSKSPSEQGRD